MDERGTRLASAVFTGETASGWQQVNFSSPVAITAGTTYVASYYAPKGHYSDTAEFFAKSGVVNAPLSFLANTVSPNGVYTYSSTSAFPTSSFDATNYWVDVVFFTTVTLRPSVVTVSPANGATSVSTGTSVTATFDESMNASTINTNSFQLSNPRGAEGSVLVPATVSYNSSCADCDTCALRTVGLLERPILPRWREGPTAFRIPPAIWCRRTISGRSPRHLRPVHVPGASGALALHRDSDSGEERGRTGGKVLLERNWLHHRDTLL